jgi:acetolactate synthase-1/2/3 large subunit
VLGIGCRFSETTTLGWTLIPPGTPIIQVNTDIREIGRQFPVSLGIAADARAFLEALLAELRASGAIRAADRTQREARVTQLQALRALDRAAFFERATDAVPIKPQTIIKEVIEVAGREAIYCVGQGNLTSFCTRAPIYRPGSYLQSAGLGTLGYAFPAALGAQLASPGQRVFCLAGDGDFGSVMQDLDTAVRESLSVITLVFNNGGFGVNRLNQLSRGVKPFGVDFLNPDFAALARMYGMQGIRVENPHDLRAALKEVITAGGPALLDLQIDPGERVGANPKAVGLYT